MEGSGKGGGLHFHCQNFNKKEPMFKAPMIGLETIVFSYRQTEDAAEFVKSNEALYRYVGVNLRVGGTIATREILSIEEPYLRLLKELDDTARKVAFLKLETEFKAIPKKNLTWKENRQKV